MCPRSMAYGRKLLGVIIVSASSFCVELYGRHPICICSFTFLLILLIHSAAAPSTQTLIITGFFDGVSGSAFLSVAGSSVGNLFNREQLQAPMLIIYTACPFIGISFGPLTSAPSTSMQIGDGPSAF
ncbi:hypothetical protein DSL72_007250 [Monilinia vaccinii-corymbosi]|uniref:Major facilitator superfamily (MFS) profile domain-containing protein n=1 Tax=Monilinia vaccinii-corymbosi TaxID=61207 RepID=A0A8A3PMD9_9HELO|nr:hypothetical protein DSL72_007250 [Monilinia vaccinii-corymbosi]